MRGTHFFTVKVIESEIFEFGIEDEAALRKLM
jgi:hypothetical protein